VWLRDFNVAGVLTAADVHVAQRVGALGGESDEAVLARAGPHRPLDAARLGRLDLGHRGDEHSADADQDDPVETAELALACRRTGWPDVRRAR
jgi:exodeoxyribonuclease V alpha subunit